MTTTTPLGGTHTVFDAFAVKAYDNVYATADTSSVVNYLAVMVAEFEMQVRHWTGLENYGKAAEAKGRLDAYRDTLRVLDIAVDSALHHTPTA